jgi:hypothetical protein
MNKRQYFVARMLFLLYLFFWLYDAFRVSMNRNDFQFHSK